MSGLVEWIDTGESRIADLYDESGTWNTYRGLALHTALTTLVAAPVAAGLALLGFLLTATVPNLPAGIYAYTPIFEVAFNLFWSRLEPD